MGVLFLLLFIPWIKGCFHPKPKEIITFIDLAAMPPPAPVSVPEPVPEPTLKPKPIPKPAVTNTPPKIAKPKPKKIAKKQRLKHKSKPKHKPKTLAERLAEVRKNGKPVTVPSVKPRPQLDFSRIKSTLNSASTGAGSETGSESGMYSPFAGYYDSVKRQMYSVWQQPAGAPIGLSATATLRVERNGTVSAKNITRRSGNAPFDQSVQNALNATTRLPVPPANLPGRNIEIEFVLSR